MGVEVSGYRRLLPSRRSQRLAEEVARSAAISAISMGGSLVATGEDFVGPEPAMVQQRLAAIRDTLNSRDPHFQYDIAISRYRTEYESQRCPWVKFG